MAAPVAVENYEAQDAPDRSLPLGDQRRAPLYSRWSAQLLAGTDFENVREPGAADAPSFLPDQNARPAEPGPADMVVQEHWRGTVTAVEGEIRYVQLVGQDDTIEETVLQPYQISRSELAGAVEGASFEWRLGYRDEPGGRRVGLSFIEFAPPYELSRHERAAAAAAGAADAERLARLRNTARGN